MKSLILFRHGKSDWDDEALPDHDRPLAKRGQKSARAMGKFLRRAAQQPDSAVTSSALRARASLEIALESGGWRCPVRSSDALYASTPAKVLEEVRAEPDSTERLLIVGHEPTWSELAAALLGGGSLLVPTGCMLRVDFDVESWKGVQEGEGKLVWLVPPRLLTDGDFDL